MVDQKLIMSPNIMDITNGEETKNGMEGTQIENLDKDAVRLPNRV